MKVLAEFLHTGIVGFHTGFHTAATTATSEKNKMEIQ